MDFPKISIVTPSFNQGVYIEKTIQSVIDQGYPNLEYIIIDGGSNDDTVAIIEKYEKNIHFWVSEKDRGQSHAINKGFEKATGDILAWLNSDDTYVSGAFNAIVDVFRQSSSIGAVVGAGEMTDGQNVLLVPPMTVTTQTLCMWHDTFFMQPSCFFTRDAWAKCGPLREEIHFAMDLDLWFRIARKYEFASTNTLLSRSLVHPEAKTTAFRGHSICDAARVILEHGGEEAVWRKLESLIGELYEKRDNGEDQALRIRRVEELVLQQDQLLLESKMRAETLQKDASVLGQRLDAMYDSWSWKVTSPLRWLYAKFQRKDG